MLLYERLAKIKEILQRDGKATISDLSSKLNVTDVTIRKDLAKLEEEKFIIKIHGGAVLNTQVDDDSSNSETDHKLEFGPEKYEIAKLAYSTINKGESIFIGSGQTCYILSQLIQEEDQISVVTNNISALDSLVKKCKNVVLLGGEVAVQNNLMFSLCNKSSNAFEGIFVNKAFTSSSGVDLNAGLTVTKESSAYIYEQISTITNNWVLMIGNSKFDKIALFNVGSIDTPSVIIADTMPDKYKEFFNSTNQTVITSN